MIRSQKQFQIPLKELLSQYKQIKRLQVYQQNEMNVMRNKITKKKVLCIKMIQNDSTKVEQFLRKLDFYHSLNSNKYVNQFIGYTIDRQQHKSNFTYHLYALYELGQISLDSFIKKSAKGTQKSYSIEFIKYLYRQALNALISIESLPNIEINHFQLNQELISVNNYGEIDQSLKFCYLPFPFLKETIIKTIDLKNQIYSAKQLRMINRESKQNQEILARISPNDIIVESQRETEHQTFNLDILHKLGLTLFKCAYYLCQDINLIEITFELYTMNQKFQIDYNWNLINAFLSQCSKHKDYVQIANTIHFMIKEITEEFSFREFNEIIRKLSPTKMNMKFICQKREPLYQYDTEQILILQPKKSKAELRQPKYQALQEIEQIVKKKTVEEIQYLDGTFYRGQIKNDVKHGLGIYYFLEGEVFGGEWREDQMYGSGVYIFVNGERYAGQIKGQVKQGFGQYNYGNGNFYIGEWLNDLKQGYGQLYTADTGETFRGYFKKNMKQGKGSIYYKNSQIFQGQFSHGFKNGKGAFYDKNGRLQMKAKWINDQIEGNAQIYYQNSDYYIGEVKNGKKNGKGTYRFFDGTLYQGEFQNDSLTGKCIIHFKNGDVYKGSIIEGKFAGEGKYTFRQKMLQYEGSWKDGLQDGKGAYNYRSKIRMNTLQQKRKLVNFEFGEKQ